MRLPRSVILRVVTLLSALVVSVALCSSITYLFGLDWFEASVVTSVYENNALAMELSGLLFALLAFSGWFYTAYVSGNLEPYFLSLWIAGLTVGWAGAMHVTSEFFFYLAPIITGLSFSWGCYLFIQYSATKRCPLMIKQLSWLDSRRLPSSRRGFLCNCKFLS